MNPAEIVHLLTLLWFEPDDDDDDDKPKMFSTMLISHREEWRDIFMTFP